MKATIGLFLIVAGIAVGLYCGLWWAFIGGIIAVIEQIRAPHMEATTLAIGIARIVFAAFIGWMCALIFLIPGVALVKSR